MSAICYKCQRYLPDNFIVRLGDPLPDNAWHMKNVCPDAAHGGIMMPICKKCDPDPLGILLSHTGTRNER